MKTAIILGATGLTGGILLQQLLKDPRYEKIKVFSRSKVAVKNNKIEENLTDLLKIEDQRENFKGDEVFCCIGTTKNKTPDEDTYKRIDYGIPVAAAKLAKEIGISTFIVISALGASKDSKIFYNRIKGEMERDVIAQNINSTYIFQPSLISGDREEKRSFEKLAKTIMTVINPLMIGPLKKYRSIHPETIAKAMIKVANNGYTKKIIPSDEIKELAGED